MSAVLQAPNPQQESFNAAPIKPLLRLQRGGFAPASYVADAIKAKFQHYHQYNKDVKREIDNVGQLVSLFINGKQYPVYSPWNGGSWGVLPNRGINDDRRALNVMRNLVQNLLTKWENSTPDILIRAARNLDKCQSAAKAADAINNFYERQFYNSWFTQQEGLMGMTFGTYIDRYRFDDQKQSMSVIADIFEQKDVSWGDGYGFCAECGFTGKAGEFMSALGGDGPMAQRKCPTCHSTAVDVQQPPSGSIHSFVKRQEQKLGDLTCELLPVPACRWDLAKRPEDSDWLIYRQRIPRGAVTKVMGSVQLPDSGIDDHGLEVLKSLQRQGQALGGRSHFGNQASDREIDSGDFVTFDEMWLAPECYADVKLIGNEETIGGQQLPKGKLIDVFPDGLCAVGLNGMAIVLALYPERHKNHIVSGSWFMQGDTGVGRGLADSVEIQKQFNTLNSQAVSYMAATYTPAIGYDNQIWKGSQAKYIGSPRTNIPFDLTKLPEGRKLHDSIYQFQPTAMPGQFFNYAQDFLSVMFQKTSMVTDYAQGEPGITGQNTTATAAEIDQSNADAINQPIFLIKADARKRGAEITIRLFRQHFPMKRYFDLGGKYGREQGIQLSAADVDTDLLFEVVKNSEMPKGPFTRQKNRIQFFNILGGAEGYLMLRQQDPKLANEIEREFDVDLETDDYDAVNELCLRRLGQMQNALKLGVTEPLLLIEAIQPPISQYEKELREKADWFARWLSLDDGQEAPPPLRAAAEMLAAGQFEGSVTQESALALGEGMKQAAMVAPTAMGEAALSQQPESTEPDPSAQLQFAQEQSTQAHEREQNALDREHELKMLDKEESKDKSVAKADADAKIRVEKSKPKPVAKAATKK